MEEAVGMVVGGHWIVRMPMAVMRMLSYGVPCSAIEKELGLVYNKAVCGEKKGL